MNTAGNSLLLDRIIEVKKKEISRLDPDLADKAVSLAAPVKNRFRDAIKRRSGERIRIIAETKKASPSKGLLAARYSAGENARKYKEAGADAVSVLTDHQFFAGSLQDLSDAAKAGLPVLRKDFIISELQIAEAALNGASAVLLIVRILTPAQLKKLMIFAQRLGLDVLTETHNEAEVMTALDAGAQIIGINHRDLDTLQLDLSLTEKLSPLIRSYGKNAVVVAESGIESRESLMRAADPFADAALIGHLFMHKENAADAMRELFKD